MKEPPNLPDEKLKHQRIFWDFYAASAKSLQLCPTLCDPTDGSPPSSPVLGILQARTLEWVAISLSNAWKWKVKVKSLSRVRPSATPCTAAFQAPPSMGFSRQEYWSGVPLISIYRSKYQKIIVLCILTTYYIYIYIVYIIIYKCILLYIIYTDSLKYQEYSRKTRTSVFPLLCLHRFSQMGFWKTQIKPETLPGEVTTPFSFIIFAFSQFKTDPFLCPC